MTWRQVLLDDMSEAYNALRAGRTPVLPLVRLQYPDFAAWQIRHLASPAVQRQVQEFCLFVRYAQYLWIPPLVYAVAAH